MPQKKKSTIRKTKKRTTRKIKKPKVYIPAYKIIGLCAFVITVCVGLLLITTLSSPKPTSLSQRFEQVNQSEQISNQPALSEKPAQPEKPVKPVEKKPEESIKKLSKPIENPYIEKPEIKSESKTENKPEIIKPDTKPQEKPVQQTPEQKKHYDFPKAVNGAKLIFVFDDAGQNNSQLEKFLSLPFPITVAVLPQLKDSASAAQKIRTSGNEVILHQPMQAINEKINPGLGAIKPQMTDEEIKSILFQNINEIAPIAGMNNHEGSAITADADKMAVILQMASEEGIYFLDSRTNVDTKVPYVAKEMGYSYYERNIFLDNEKTKENALKELNKGLTIANKNGSVIMIGHIWSSDFLPDFLREVYPELKQAGYNFTTVSKSTPKK